MWKENMVKLQNFSISPQGIHTIVTVNTDSTTWLFSANYFSHDHNIRTTLWDELYQISSILKMEWLIGGDFNEVMIANEKLGEAPINNARVSRLWDCLNHCNMVDLVFRGCKYIWTNKRYQNKTILIQERPDRCMANDS